MAFKYQSPPLPYKRIFSSLFGLSILIILLVLTDLAFNSKVLLFILAICFGSYYFSLEALESILFKHKITTDVMMFLAYLAAGLMGQFTEATMLIFLYSITETLESVTIKRTRSMIYSVVSAIPPSCIVLTDSGKKIMNIDDLVPEDIILVKSGDVIPIDGVIIEGDAYINESSLTGEYLPVFKSIKNLVFAGTLVIDSVLKIKVLKPTFESAVSKLIKSVEEAQKHKHPLDLLVNRFTKIYNPIIIFISGIILIYGILVDNVQVYGTMSASFLIAGAPCALAIGTPVTVIAAIGSSGKNGILVKGGSSLERLADINALAFDKTGTLTIGKPVLVELIPINKSEQEILAITSGLENASSHPFAKTIIETAETQQITPFKMVNNKVIPGYGVEGNYNNKNYYIGSFHGKYSTDSSEILEKIENFKDQGFSVTMVFEVDQLIGILLFKDAIREQTHETIKKLHQNQYKTFILTGDSRKNALAIGSKLNIPDEYIFSDLKPNDKMKKIIELKNSYNLAMIGDGINDGPALAAADLGIAMGTIGSDIAIDTAEIIIMSESLAVLHKGISIATKMKSVLKQNIITSSLIILGVLFGVVTGYLTLPIVILAHEGSEVLIIGNSLRLLSNY